MLLALDTATRQSGIALFDGHQLVAELNWHSTDAQTVELMPRLAQLLDWSGLTPAQLTALAVGLGPGSYTGLRVAVSAAKGMALAFGLPLFGISTLDATAFAQLGRPEPVCALVAAGRGRLCWSTYWPMSGDTTRRLLTGRRVTIGAWAGWQTPAELSDVDRLAGEVHEPTWFVGEMTTELRRQLHARLGANAMVMPVATATRRAGVLAELAWMRLQAGEGDDLASLSPIYLREP